VRIVLASGNAGKLREIRAVLAPLGLELTAQDTLGIPSPAETGATFEENALLKARYASLEANLPAVADDSGIEVHALGGRPGVFSARYAGAGATDQENVRKLLEELRDVPAEARGARFCCVIAYVATADATPLLVDGSWEGTILFEPRGTSGFGYDPVFLPGGFDRSAAELAPVEKNAVSHRGKALRALAARLGNPGV
jgi:XTP/dITP diphosphohydrolase